MSSALALPLPHPPRPGHPARLRQSAGIAAACGLHALAGALIVHLALDTAAPQVPPQSSVAVRLIAAEPPAPRPRDAAPPSPARPTPPSARPRPAPTTPTAPTAPGTTAPAEPLTRQDAPTGSAASAPSSAPTPARDAVAPSLVAPRFDADYLANPAPPYPGMSRRLGETGRVLLRVRVGSDGQPLDVGIAQSSGFARLDEAARAAVARWRFVPARQGDQPVVASVQVPIVFTLNNKELP